jgi:uroporphyrinogen-III synthase
MPDKPSLVLTRPASRQQGLIEVLTCNGMTVLAMPALSIEPLIAPEIIQSDLKFYNLIVFVSRAAVEHFPSDLHLDLSQTHMAAVGDPTALAIRQRFGPLATVLCSPEGARQDSETLWQVLSPVLTSLSRVLIVRAETGRDWLSDQLSSKGCQVDLIAVYARKPCSWSAEQVQKLNVALTLKVPLIWLFTSAESVEVVASQFNVLGIEASQAIQGVVVTHPKVLERVSRLLATVFFDDLSSQKGHAFTPSQVVAPCEQEILQGLMKLSKFLQS